MSIGQYNASLACAPCPARPYAGVDIADLQRRASAFKQKLRDARGSVPAPDFEWYPESAGEALAEGGGPSV